MPMNLDELINYLEGLELLKDSSYGLIHQDVATYILEELYRLKGLEK